ncbi:MAG: dCTP deaminase [Desulfurococcales archaeon]|nr:dCTP deaminase [Desulfurococcales archaeon]
MILGDYDIYLLLKAGDLVIKPFDEEIVRENGLDLRLGRQFCRFKRVDKVLDPRNPGDPSEFYECSEADEIIIPPNQHVLLHTLEYIKLPSYVAGLVNLRSTWARTGIYVPACFTADTIVLDASGVPLEAIHASCSGDADGDSLGCRKYVAHWSGIVYRVNTGLEELTVTSNHKFLAFDPDSLEYKPFKSIEAQHLNTTHLIANHRRIPIPIQPSGNAYLDVPGDLQVLLDSEGAELLLSKVDEAHTTVDELAKSLGLQVENLKQFATRKGSLRPLSYTLFKKLLAALNSSIDDFAEYAYIYSAGEGIPLKNLPRRVSSDIAWFTGVFTTAGKILRNRVELVFELDKDDIIDKMLETLIALAETPNVMIRRTGGERVVSVRSSILAKWLSYNFPEITTDMIRRSYPTVIALSRNEINASYIAGLIDSQLGSRSENLLVIRAMNGKFARQLQLILGRLGITSSVSKVGNDYTVRPILGDLKKLLKNTISKLVKHFAVKNTNDYIPLTNYTRMILKSLTLDINEDIVESIRAGRVPLNKVGLLLDLLSMHDARTAGSEIAYQQLVEASKYYWSRVSSVTKTYYSGVIVDWQTKSHWQANTLAVTHNTVVDAGFEGQLTIEIIGSSFPVKLYPGDRFLHLVLVKLNTPAHRPYRGQYKGQTGVRLPKFFPFNEKSRE